MEVIVLKRNIIAKILLSLFMVPSLMATTVPTYAAPEDNSTTQSINDSSTTNAEVPVLERASEPVVPFNGDKLEPVYLANVLLYARNNRTVNEEIEFNCISKSTREAAKMLKTIDLEHFLNIRDFTNLYPNVETITLTADDLVHLSRTVYDEYENSDLLIFLDKISSCNGQIKNIFIDFDSYKGGFHVFAHYRSQYEQAYLMDEIISEGLVQLFEYCNSENINILFSTLIMQFRGDAAGTTVLDEKSKILFQKALENNIPLKHLYLFNLELSNYLYQNLQRAIPRELNNIIRPNTKITRHCMGYYV